MRVALSLASALVAFVPAHAADAPVPKPHKKSHVVLYEVVVEDGMRRSVTLNGFDLEELVSSQNLGKPVGGHADALNVSAVHPYFLTSDNLVRLEATLDESLVGHDEKGPWHVDVRIAAVSLDEPPGFMGTWTEEELVRIKTAPSALGDKMRKKAEGRFAWNGPVPRWSWTTAPLLTKDAATKDAVHAALSAFHGNLVALGNGKLKGAERERFTTAVKAQAREYEAACAFYGKRRSFPDELFQAAATLSLPGDDAVRAEVRNRKPRPPRLEPRHDEHPEPDPADYEGKHLTLMPLAQKSELELELIGDGRLARLVGSSGPPIVFRSNWPDGGWGAVGDTKVEADVWFRKGKDGAWEVDALVDADNRNLSLLDDTLPELLERSGLR